MHWGEGAAPGLPSGSLRCPNVAPSVTWEGCRQHQSHQRDHQRHLMTHPRLLCNLCSLDPQGKVKRAPTTQRESPFPCVADCTCPNSGDTKKKAMQQGVIIEGVLYDSCLFDHGLQQPLCFRCNRWGHTQTMCQAQPTCGHCAGDHDTSTCQHKEDNMQVHCSNCAHGGHHQCKKSNCTASK